MESEDNSDLILENLNNNDKDASDKKKDKRDETYDSGKFIFSFFIIRYAKKTVFK